MFGKNGPKTILIVGLGLMGGSLAAKCRRVYPKAKIIGLTRNKKALTAAKKKKWIHEGWTAWPALIEKMDLVVLCTPVDTFFLYLQKLNSILKERTLVTDVGSTKALISKEVRRLKLSKVDFVGAHPMVGSHKRGMTAAHADLYDKGLAVVTAAKKTASSKTVVSFWKKIGLKVSEMTPERHDQLVAEISHMPHAVAGALIRSATLASLGLASTGFRDMTRVSASDAGLWTPIFLQNRKAVLKSLKSFETELAKFKKSLGSPQALHRFLSESSNKRRQI